MMHRTKIDWRGVAALAAAAAIGCGGDADETASETAEEGAAPSAVSATAPDQVAAEYADELGVDLDAMTRTPTGLYILDVREGTGEQAEAGDLVFVHYTGWLPDGEKFDSSRDRGKPFDFRLGQSQVIPGWDEGVAGMRAGGQRRLVIPSGLGYGATGTPGGPIPPNATLVFDVELLEIR